MLVTISAIVVRFGQDQHAMFQIAVRSKTVPVKETVFL